MHIVDLPASADFDSWRNEARRLLQAGVPPEDVHWPVPTDAQEGLFSEAATAQPDIVDTTADGSNRPQHLTGSSAAIHEDQAGSHFPAAPLAAPSSGAAPRVPPAFLTLAQTALLHSDPHRFGLLYRLLWRHSREPNLRHDALDPDVVRANVLAQSVRRDMH
ncbi:MAG: hypothetical protein JWQ11_1477, partial [Rhizobacter sp.]|nr:hypothetical protein [Rhizobacter sp.]